MYSVCAAGGAGKRGRQALMAYEPKGEDDVAKEEKTPNLTDHDAAAHENHLCILAELRQMGTVAKMARDGKFICHACGRVAANAENLCEPVKL
jgi:hypothetical protein